MGLNEALSVTALKCDSLINKVSFPAQHYYFRIRGLGRGVLLGRVSQGYVFIFTFKLFCPPDFSYFFSLPARIQKSQPPSCGIIGH